MLLCGSCLSGELVPAFVPVVEDDLGTKDDGTFDLPFFCVGRLIVGASWKAAWKPRELDCQ